jgi:hypothetical protein
MRKSMVRQIDSLNFWRSLGNIATTRKSFTFSTWLQALVYVEKKGMERGQLEAALGAEKMGLGFSRIRSESG